MKLTLYRLTESPAVPTYGVLLKETGVPFALTLERPWRDNQPNVSCIPRGRYIARRHISPRFGETFWVQNVPGRSEILFHPGNLADDSHGCILVGEKFDPLNGQDGILASKEGFNEFLDLTKGLDEFVLHIDGRYAR